MNHSVMGLLSQTIQSRYAIKCPNFRSGDTVKVTTRITNNKGKAVDKFFEGVCIRVRNRNTSLRFILRKVIGDTSVEGHFTNKSITEAKIIKYGVMRRAAGYFLRQLKGKKARIKEDFSRRGT